jgi:hypothetical protein
MYPKPRQPTQACILLRGVDPFLQAGLASLLGDAGYVLAEEGAAPQAAERIDLVLAGFHRDPAAPAVARRLNRAVPVILLVDHTAWSNLDFLDAANRCSAAAVLPQPFSRALLLSLVARTLARAAQHAGDVREPELTLGEVVLHPRNPAFLPGQAKLTPR